MHIILNETEIIKILREHVQKTRAVKVDGARFEAVVRSVFTTKTIVGCQFSETYGDLTRNGEWGTVDDRDAPRRFFVVLHAVSGKGS